MFAALMKWMKARRVLPAISDTERQALEAGTVWIDGQFFGGRPDFRTMLTGAYSKLSDEEQAFLDGPVEQLLHLIRPYEIRQSKRVPDEVLAFLKREGFMGFLIPKQYGGRQFSTLAISTIFAKIWPVSATVNMFIVIPNSLGAAELILHYGTQAQKDHYLPLLARGELLPCFGLTEPTAGSDAGSIKAEGRVFRNAAGELRLRLNFSKRYITLAPVADLCTIACRLRDPENLLGKGVEPGITCVLVHRGTPGFHNGDHHDPIGDPFYNGPLYGKDVEVPVDHIIGGAERAGQGWKMLMEQLAGGRAVSLPAGVVGQSKALAVAVGAYSIVRQQFGISIGRMEGVEEKVGRIAALTYLMDAARVHACSAIDAGEKPPVVSAVLKAYTTEISQSLAVAGMDVMAGAGVMQGPNNLLGMAYKSAPVAVTVEGANILTRTLMIFGQGATRCHPYAMNVVNAVERDDAGQFRVQLLGWIRHFIAGIVRAELHWLTRGWLVSVPDVDPATRIYYRRLGWAAARFGVLTDLALFAIGGRLKVRGKLTGRYADVLAWLLLGFCTLRRFEAEGRRREDLPLVHYALHHALAQVQDAFVGIYRNFGGLTGLWMKTLGQFEARLNPVGSPPTDAMSAAAARCIQAHDEQFRRLAAGTFAPTDERHGLGRLLRAFRLVTLATPAAERIARAQKTRSLPRGLSAVDAAERAVNLRLITAAEADLLRQAQEARLEAIEVDSFAPADYFLDPPRNQIAPAQS
ncbi:MAG: acyl-CoA dehydrogenase [Panacagrimonas sp.]